MSFLNSDGTRNYTPQEHIMSNGKWLVHPLFVKDEIPKNVYVMQGYCQLCRLKHREIHAELEKQMNKKVHDEWTNEAHSSACKLAGCKHPIFTYWVEVDESTDEDTEDNE